MGIQWSIIYGSMPKRKLLLQRIYILEITRIIFGQATQGKLIHILGWRREASWLAVLESMHERTGNWLTSLVANREKIYANWSSFDQGKEGNMHARLIRISTCITKCGWPSMSNMFFLLFLGKFASCPIRTLYQPRYKYKPPSILIDIHTSIKKISDSRQPLGVGVM